MQNSLANIVRANMVVIQLSRKQKSLAILIRIVMALMMHPVTIMVLHSVILVQQGQSQQVAHVFINKVE